MHNILLKYTHEHDNIERTHQRKDNIALYSQAMAATQQSIAGVGTTAKASFKASRIRRISRCGDTINHYERIAA